MFRLRLLISSITIWFSTTASLHAQSIRNTASQTNAWFMYFGDHKFSDHWGIHLEGQWRRSDFVSSPQQLLLRTGVNYHFSPQVFATVGYAFVKTYPYGEQPAAATFPEHRLWEQIQLRSNFGRFEFINRLRLEQRWVQVPVLNPADGTYEPGDAVYTNRARPMIRVSVPFKGKTIEDHSLYISVYEEPFISFGKNVRSNIFDQNRAYIALGYKIPKVGRLEIGYLNQMIFKANGTSVENNHTLQIGLASVLEFRKAKKN